MQFARKYFFTHHSKPVDITLIPSGQNIMHPCFTTEFVFIIYDKTPQGEKGLFIYQRGENGTLFRSTSPIPLFENIMHPCLFYHRICIYHLWQNTTGTYVHFSHAPFYFEILMTKQAVIAWPWLTGFIIVLPSTSEVGNWIQSNML